MTQHITRTALIGMLLLLLLAPGAAEARYRYGSYLGGGQEQGFYVELEGGIANPRNTDNVIATTDGATASPIIPDWDDEFAGSLGLGYNTAGGTRIELRFWSFEASTRGAGTQPILLAVGPPVPGIGDSGGSFDITTEITAELGDLTWAKSHELNDTFSMEWSVGLRYANFEETLDGTYGGLGPASDQSYVAAKRNEGEMIGIRAGVQGRYRIHPSFSIRGGLGFSMLDGENSGASTLTRVGLAAPASSSFIEDDSRSGQIRDFDLAVTWHLADDRFRISFGWEQSRWEEIATDLVRNFPGTTAPLRDRDEVVFSGYNLGIYYRF